MKSTRELPLDGIPAVMYIQALGWMQRYANLQ
jgi:hypothetical protein